jgi:hypothetical protein
MAKSEEEQREYNRQKVAAWRKKQRIKKEQAQEPRLIWYAGRWLWI